MQGDEDRFLGRRIFDFGGIGGDRKAQVAVGFDQTWDDRGTGGIDLLRIVSRDLSMRCDGNNSIFFDQDILLRPVVITPGPYVAAMKECTLDL
ncbi:hypothetical protein GCM10011614_27860 [Novosphingobium colocasiae]|uniref:Uncharacterized protein n=1 Tax=Novosphingobium colocasiae TaxID=1256513 RepID=A0A918PI83_9SPHN|nr:hypothetical protein GCM10011614_27860 [Novosphingobium colocasiae]